MEFGLGTYSENRHSASHDRPLHEIPRARGKEEGQTISMRCDLITDTEEVGYSWREIDRMAVEDCRWRPMRW